MTLCRLMVYLDLLVSISTPVNLQSTTSLSKLLRVYTSLRCDNMHVFRLCRQLVFLGRLSYHEGGGEFSSLSSRKYLRQMSVCTDVLCSRRFTSLSVYRSAVQHCRKLSALPIVSLVRRHNSPSWRWAVKTCSGVAFVLVTVCSLLAAVCAVHCECAHAD